MKKQNKNEIITWIIILSISLVMLITFYFSFDKNLIVSGVVGFSSLISLSLYQMIENIMENIK